MSQAEAEPGYSAEFRPLLILGRGRAFVMLGAEQRIRDVIMIIYANMYQIVGFSCPKLYFWEQFSSDIIFIIVL